MTQRWIATTAWGDRTPGVPAGKTIVCATEDGGRGPRRYFSMKNNEYVPRMEIDPQRFAEVANPRAARASGELAADPDALGTALPWPVVIARLEGRSQ